MSLQKKIEQEIEQWEAKIEAARDQIKALRGLLRMTKRLTEGSVGDER